VTREEKARVMKEKKQEQKKSNRENPVETPVVAVRQENVPFPHVAGNHIQSMEQHNRRHQELELFAAQVERPDKPTTDMIIQTPTMVQILAYCKKFENMRPSLDQYMQELANHPNLSFQKLPVYTRQTLQAFLREADPHLNYERPCFNLDRDPRQGEAKFRCVAHYLSEKQLGPGRGYRLRELLFPEQIVSINQVVEVEQGDARSILNPMPEMCVMCHIFFTNQVAMDQKNKAEERANQDLTTERPLRAPLIRIANRFMVTIGSEGEYDPRRMLVSNNVALGVLGPFPLWSERHYQACMLNRNLRGFVEAPVLVFRLSREPSQQIESSNTSGSMRSTPTNAKRGSTASRQ
jgi:hypothetical protein